MTLHARRLLTLAAWGVFLASAPLLVGYALGHRITPRAPVPAAVGAFLIRTFPRGVTVSVDGTPHPATTPTAIQSLPPGTYTLRLEKPGYRTWEKRLAIVGTRVTDVRNVRLLPTKIEEETLRSNVLEFSVSPRERWLALIEQTTGQHRQLRMVPFVRVADPGIVTPLRLERSERVEFLWSADERSVIVSLRAPGGGRFFSVTPPTGRVERIRADDVLGWLPGRPESLVLRRGSSVIAHNRANSTERRLASDVRAAAVSAHDVVVVTGRDAPDSTVTLTRIRNGTHEQIPSPALAGRGLSTISASPTGDVALLTTPGETLLLWSAVDRSWREVAGHAEHLRWSPDGEKLLWQSSEFDLWVLNLREQRSPLPLFTPELTVRLSVPVRDPHWFAGGQHVLFRERDIIQLVEIDPRDGHRTEAITSTNRGDSVARAVDDGRAILTTAEREGVPVILRAFLRTPDDR